MTRFAALAVTATMIAGGSPAPAQYSLPARIPVTAAPARTVLVPPGDTVMLTPVYPVHYPAPIYMTPPLYGNYVPPYYLPAAYFQAVPVSELRSTAADIPAGRTPPPPLTSTRSTTVQRTEEVETVRRDWSPPEK